MKISAKVMDKIIFSLIMLFLLVPLTVFAANKVIVIPLFDTTNPMSLKNIITVAKGNGKFTDPVAAVNSITNASATNPYLVVIGPGVYTITQTLIMKPYVDIAGSGENVTKITGAIGSGIADASSAVISGSNDSALGSLTVENTGGGTQCIAIYNGGAWSTMTNVTALGSWGSSNNYGVYNNNHSYPTMTSITATAYTGTVNYGVFNYDNSGPKIRHATMDGGTAGLCTSTAATATVSQSTIIGGASVLSTGTNQCVACDNGIGKALDKNCVVIP